MVVSWLGTLVASEHEQLAEPLCQQAMLIARPLWRLPLKLHKGSTSDLPHCLARETDPKGVSEEFLGSKKNGHGRTATSDSIYHNPQPVSLRRLCGGAKRLKIHRIQLFLPSLAAA